MCAVPELFNPAEAAKLISALQSSVPDAAPLTTLPSSSLAKQQQPSTQQPQQQQPQAAKTAIGAGKSTAWKSERPHQLAASVLMSPVKLQKLIKGLLVFERLNAAAHTATLARCFYNWRESARISITVSEAMAAINKRKLQSPTNTAAVPAVPEFSYAQRVTTDRNPSDPKLVSPASSNGRAVSPRRTGPDDDRRASRGQAVPYATSSSNKRTTSPRRDRPEDTGAARARTAMTSPKYDYNGRRRSSYEQVKVTSVIAVQATKANSRDAAAARRRSSIIETLNNTQPRPTTSGYSVQSPATRDVSPRRIGTASIEQHVSRAAAARSPTSRAYHVTPSGGTSQHHGLAISSAMDKMKVFQNTIQELESLVKASSSKR